MNCNVVVVVVVFGGVLACWLPPEESNAHLDYAICVRHTLSHAALCYRRAVRRNDAQDTRWHTVRQPNMCVAQLERNTPRRRRIRRVNGELRRKRRRRLQRRR